MANLNLTEITFDGIKTKIETYLKQEYSKSNIIYSPSSPYGQILFVIQNLFQLSLLYLKNSVKQYDISDANSNNIKIIRNTAVVAGHLPSRSASATGVLKFSVKTSVDISSDIPGNRITFTNKQLLKNKTNGLNYSLQLGSDKITYKVDTNSVQIFINLIQGEWITEPFTGDGTINQTFQIVPRSAKQDVENYNVQVLVNGVYWTVKKHLIELLSDEQACVVRTGYNGGIDVVFGNSSFGAIPPVAANIQVSYLLTDGNIGNIFRRTPNDWTFVESAIDGFGNTIDASKIFDISIYNDINFGADMEDISFTKNILPISSNNFVLALPQQYAYAIKRLGLFSYVNAYEQYGTIYIVAAPNVSLFKNQNADYFSIPLSAFQIDSYEASKIDTYLRAGGNILLTKRYQIVSPDTSLYTINVFYISYSDAQDDTVNTQINDVISNYFLSFNRINRIPKVELVTAIAAISDIHSVDVNFVSKKNEDYHRQNNITVNNLKSTAAGAFQVSTAQQVIGYTASQVLGLDPVLGDILFEPNEIPIIRGGFYDRNNVFYSDDNNNSGLKSVNFFKKGTVDPSQKSNF
jgi:hypothetical protein